MLLRKKYFIQSISFFTLFFCFIQYSPTYSKASKRRLNILFIVNHFPSPSQTFILNIMTGLIDQGHSVSVFSYNKGDYSNIHPRVIEYNLLQHTTYEKLPRTLEQYDIVFCQFGYLGKKIIEKENIKNRLKTGKLVVCFRGADLSARIKLDPKLYNILFKHVDLCLPVCDYFKKRLIALGCNPNKVAVHYSAINCEEFFFNPAKRPSNNEIINIVSVCRLVKKKGIDYAIKAIAKVVEKHDNVRFTIIGEGPERQYLELLIRHLKLEKYVTLFGWATQQQVISLLSRSHIFILPSRKAPDGNEEGIPNAIKEAMAMGLVAVATWHAGNSELIDDKVTGFLVPEKNSDKLAEAIKYIIDNPDIWEPITIAARKKVEEKFETKKSIKRLEQLFYSLVN